MHVHVLGCMRVCVFTCMHVCTVREWQCGNEGGCQRTGWHWCAVTVDLLKVWSALLSRLFRPTVQTFKDTTTACHTEALIYLFFTVHLVCLCRSPTEVFDLLFLGWPIQERVINEQRGATCKNQLQSKSHGRESELSKHVMWHLPFPLPFPPLPVSGGLKLSWSTQVWKKHVVKG